MKNILSLVFALFTFVKVFGQHQNNAVINLNIKNSIAQKLDVTIYKDGEPVLLKTMQLSAKRQESIDIDVPVGGREQFTVLHFSNSGPNTMLILMSGERLILTTDLADPHKIDENTTFKGSELTQACIDYFDTTRENAKKYITARNNFINAVIAGRADTAKLKFIEDSLNIEKINYQKRLGLKTSSSTLLGFVLAGTTISGYNFSSDEYRVLKEKFKDDPYTIKILSKHEYGASSATGVNYEINAIAIDSYPAGFTLPDRKGRQISLVQFRGKYVLVDIWSSWCGPCREEMPNLKEALQHFRRNNFIILSVSIDDNHNNWLKAIKKDGTGEFVHVIDDKGWNGEIIKMYQIKGIPSNFLIDPSGKVIAKNLRGREMIMQLAELYKRVNSGDRNKSYK